MRKHIGDWAKTIDGAFAVINLSGENIGEGRWTSEKKEKILHSRLDSSKVLARSDKTGEGKTESSCHRFGDWFLWFARR